DLLHRRLGLPRPLALIGAGLVGLLALLLFGFLAAASVARITRGLEGYQARLHELTEEVARVVPLEKLGLKRDAEGGQVFTVPGELSRQVFSSLLNAATELVSTGALVVVFMLFMLLGRHSGVHDPTSLLAEIERRIKHYLLQLVGFSAVTGLL